MATVASWWSRPWVWWCAFVLTVVGGVALLVITVASSNAALAYVVATGVWALVGLILWRKRPENPMGPLITVTGLTSLGIVPGFLMGAYFEQFEATITPRPWPMVLGLAVSGAYTFLTVLTITLFPDGRPRSTPERWLVGLILVATGVAVASGLLSEPLGSFDHPFASPEIATTARSTFDSMLQVYGFFLLAAYVFKVVDFRRSESVRRAQLKWLIYTLTLYLVFTIVSFGLIGMEDFNLTGLTLDALFLGLIPTTMAVAVLRYRLYEIDRIVSRTVTYAIVVIVVAAVFAVPVILIPSRLGTSSDWVVAGATLAAAAVFNPVRRSIQTRVDRRFNRSRYNAAREVEDLAARLGAAPASEPPIEDTVDLVVRLLEPAAIGVWVRG